MALTNAGRNAITALLLGEAVTAFNNANAYIGVGDSSTAFAATQTDLQAATNKFRQGMVTANPSRVDNVITLNAVFATGSANFAWEEWGIFNASTAGTMLQRKVEALGTKTSAQSWALTLTITVTAA